MKNFNIIYLLFIIPILYGCTSAEALPENLSSVVDSSAVIESSTETLETEGTEDETKFVKEIQNVYSETNSDGICLELVDVSDSDPIYTLTFKRKNTNTGNYLKYANLNTEKEDSLDNIDIKVEPNSYYGYWLETEDSYSINICNIECNESIKFIIDGLEYTFSPDREKQEERVLNKNIEVKGESVLIEKAVFYPKYVALYLSKGTGNIYENMFLAVDSEGKRRGPGVYQLEDSKVLIYEREEVANDDTLHLQVGQQNEFEDINVELK